jgi:hypothetical protein
MKCGRGRWKKRKVTIGTAHAVTVNSLIELNKQTNKHVDEGMRRDDALSRQGNADPNALRLPRSLVPSHLHLALETEDGHLIRRLAQRVQTYLLQLCNRAHPMKRLFPILVHDASVFVGDLSQGAMVLRLEGPQKFPTSHSHAGA